MDTQNTIDVHCETIGLLVRRYPKIFKGQFPLLPSVVPPGWYLILNELCALFEELCSDEQLSKLEVIQITKRFDSVWLNYVFRCLLTDDQTEVIDARVFAMRNRSRISCVICGKFAETLPLPMEEMLCARHIGDRLDSVDTTI